MTVLLKIHRACWEMFQAGTFFLLTVSILQPRSMKLANVNVAKKGTPSVFSCHRAKASSGVVDAFLFQVMKTKSCTWSCLVLHLVKTCGFLHSFMAWSGMILSKTHCCHWVLLYSHCYTAWSVHRELTPKLKQTVWGVRRTQLHTRRETELRINKKRAVYYGWYMSTK